MTALRDRRPKRLLLDGETVEIRVRESTRSRSWRLTVGPGRPPELVVPRRVGSGEIDRILESRRGWIGDQLRRLRERPSRLGLRRPGFVPLQGGHVPVVRTPAARSVAALRRGRLVVGGPRGREGEAIARWYRREAKRRIEAVAAREGARLGLTFTAISIRDQRTRWGSCSSTGTLSFNWRLLLAPPAVLDYVVVHELCHLREPNHSQRFWRLVDAALPDRRAPMLWLREHALELQAFDPAAP